MTPAAAGPPPGGDLVRSIRRWDLVALAINAIIGAGIFGLPAQAFALAGPASVLACVVCGALVTLIILCFAEVSSRYAITGGPYVFAREAFGRLVGFEVGWLTWISRVAAFAANTNLLMAYAAVFVPGVERGAGRAALATAVVAALAALNIRGVRDATAVSNVLTVSKLVPLGVFIVVGAAFVDPARLSSSAGIRPGDFSLAVLLLVYAFTGFEMAVIPAGELRDPGRDVPRALLTAMGIVVVVYVLIQVVAVGVLPGLGQSTRPLADAATRFLGPSGAVLMSAGALVSILGNLNATLLVAPRLVFAMARERELPPALAIVHPRFHTPYVAVLLTAALVLLLTLSGTFVYAVTISVLARLVSYAVTAAALVVLRRKAGVPPARFVIPGGPIVAALALVAIGWLVANSTAREARDAAVAALIGLALYAAARRSRMASGA